MKFSLPFAIRTLCFVALTFLTFIAMTKGWQTVDTTNGETTLRSLPLALSLFAAFYLCVSVIFGIINGLKLVSGLWLLLPLASLILAMITNGDSPGIGFLPLLVAPLGLAGLIASLIVGFLLIVIVMHIRKIVPLKQATPLSLRALAFLSVLFYVFLGTLLISNGFSF